jgi:dTDP-4-amino-4,6-dideoxygalactose transaminase
VRVKFIDFSCEYDFLWPKLEPKVRRIIKKGTFILGEELRKFEEEFARYCNRKFAVGVNSGTDALFLSLLVSGIGKGDEVIVPAFTYIATALAVSYTGAKPVFCDVREDTCAIDIDDMKRKITRRTKAIMVVHLYGHPAQMDEILKIADKYGLRVIEDCAQAHGAMIGNRKVGSFGDFGCFSFYPTKNLSCYGDGGIIVTNSKGAYKKLICLRDYGRISKYKSIMIGYNSRLDNIQASILRVKLGYLERWTERRRKLARLYNRLLAELEEIKTPVELAGFRHVYHVYVIKTKLRDKLYKGLRSKGIEALIHYPILKSWDTKEETFQFQRGCPDRS